MENPKFLEVLRQENATVARLKVRRILEDDQVEMLGEELGKALTVDSPAKLVVNFSEVQFLCSAALGKLIVAHRQARQQGCQMIFCNLQQPVGELLAATRLNEVFELCTDEVAALTDL